MNDKLTKTCHSLSSYILVHTNKNYSTIKLIAVVLFQLFLPMRVKHGNSAVSNLEVKDKPDLNTQVSRRL